MINKHKNKQNEDISYSSREPLNVKISKFLKLICVFTAITIQIPNTYYLLLVTQFGTQLISINALTNMFIKRKLEIVSSGWEWKIYYFINFLIVLNILTTNKYYYYYQEKKHTNSSSELLYITQIL